MGLTEKIAVGLLALFALVAAAKLMKAPLRTLLRVLCNTLLGFGALFLLNLTTPVTGLSLGFNVLNALVIGILGLPGFLLLLLSQWVLL